MTRQDQLNRAENILREAADAIADAFAQAMAALKDTQDYLEDAISSVVDGFGIGADDD